VTILATRALAHDQSGTCAHAVEQSARATTALTQAENVCRMRGVRLTPIRRQVLEALYATHRPLGAYDLAEQLGPKGRRLAPITVYRALEFLIDQSLVHRLASLNAYVACPHGHPIDRPVAFLICESCGGVDEIASPALAGTLADLLAAEGFTRRTETIEIAGHCAHCRSDQ
jgi:Fur family zinc uptake transcriptional regulator